MNLWLIPILPLLGFLANGLFGRRIPKALINTFAVGSVALSFAWVVKTLLALDPIETKYVEHYFTWIQSGTLSIGVDFAVDRLTAIMLMIVTGVGTLIHIYAVGYMKDEGGYYRFFAFLNLFMFFMLVLVLAQNYLLLFVGWEGVGLCSYLLVGFYITEQYATTAGNKAFIVNRIGDFGFSLAVFLIFRQFGTLDFSKVFDAAKGMPLEASAGILTAITLLLLVGATGKSAQIPLYVWLPDAMAGPTPVSALIHAATMVTAGVYMTARSAALFLKAPISMDTVAVIGLATAFFAATIGMTQMDLKKVYAYSTVSQLGYMFLGVGVGAFSAGIYHVMTHAFFKGVSRHLRLSIYIRFFQQRRDSRRCVRPRAMDVLGGCDHRGYDCFLRLPRLVHGLPGRVSRPRASARIAAGDDRPVDDPRGSLDIRRVHQGAAHARADVRGGTRERRFGLAFCGRGPGGHLPRVRVLCCETRLGRFIRERFGRPVHAGS